MPRIGIIVGSIASGSINRVVANTLPALATDPDAQFEINEIKDLPMYTYDLDASYPESALALKNAIESVDGVIIVTPEYARSIPGVLKNALDWSSRPWGQNSFDGKPVAIMGASIGITGTAAAQQHLRAILGHFNAATLGQPETFFQFRPEAFAADGSVQDEAAKAILSNFVNATVDHVKRHALVNA